jgi:hypothetical protein
MKRPAKLFIRPSWYARLAGIDPRVCQPASYLRTEALSALEMYQLRSLGTVRKRARAMFHPVVRALSRAHIGKDSPGLRASIRAGEPAGRPGKALHGRLGTRTQADALDDWLEPLATSPH